MTMQINTKGFRNISNMKNFQRHIFYFLISLLLLPVTAFAAGEVTRNIIEISPGIGYYNFDDDRNIEDEAMVSLGLGLQFSRRWLALLNYSVLKVDTARPKAIIQKYHVDAHYFFNTKSAFRPYLVAGFGQLDIDDGVSDLKNMINTGLGISYKITPSWFVRTDARIFHSTNGDFQDNTLTLTFGYRFSGGEKN